MKKISMVLVICILLCSLPMHVNSANTDFAYIEVVDNNGNEKKLSIIKLENDILFSGEDLSEITGFEYIVNGDEAIFVRGKKEFKVNLKKSSYTLGDNFGIYDFENKIVYKDNKYYYSGAEVLPWLNVNCAVSDNKLFVIKDFMSIWEIDDVFMEESKNILFNFEECCNELNVSSKWLKATSYVCDMGLSDFLWVPFTSHTFGEESDYISIFEDMINNESRVENLWNQMIDTAGDVDAWISAIDDMSASELPDDIKALHAISIAFSSMDNVNEIVMYFDGLDTSCKDSILWINDLILNRGAYEYPDALLSAAINVENMYKADFEGITQKIIYTFMDDVIAEYEDKLIGEGFIDTALSLLGLDDVFEPEWRTGINQIAHYNALAQCGIEVYQTTGNSTHIYNLELKRSHAMFYLYGMEQNWRTMAQYALDKGKNDLATKYLEKAELALTLQGKFLACADSTINDSHEYDDGYCKEGYEAKLREMFATINTYSELSSFPEENGMMNSQELEAYLIENEEIIRTWVLNTIIFGMQNFGELNESIDPSYDIYVLLHSLSNLDDSYFGFSEYITLSREYADIVIDKYIRAEGYDFDSLINTIKNSQYIWYDESTDLIYFAYDIGDMHGSSIYNYELLNNGNVGINVQWLITDVDYEILITQKLEFTTEDIPRLVSYHLDRNFLEYEEDVYNSEINASEIEIKGVRYDMSDNYMDIGKRMQENGLLVYLPVMGGLKGSPYNENMEVNLDIDVGSTNKDSVALYTKVAEDYTLHRAWYIISSSQNKFQTGQGIAEYSDVYSITEPKFYQKSAGYYTALCISNELVDLEQYESAYTSWAEDIDKIGLLETQKKYFYNYSEEIRRELLAFGILFSADYLKFSPNLDELKKEYDGNGYNHKEEILFAFAIMDAYEKLASGEIDTYTVIRYRINDENCISGVEYFNYFLNSK